jgi:hypothetical protein
MLFRSVVLTALLAVPAWTGTITNVSAATSAAVDTGDSLIFHLSTANFSKNAAAFGLPISPTDLQFDLWSSLATDFGNFSATLERADGTVAMAFDSLAGITGTYYSQSGNRDGAVLEGKVHQSGTNSIFSDPLLLLIITNNGPGEVLSFGGMKMSNVLTTSVSGNGLGTGGVVTKVELVRYTPLTNLGPLGELDPPSGGGTTHNPEPATLVLMLGGGVLMGGIGVLRRAFGNGAKRGAQQDKSTEVSTVCIR